MLHLFVFAFVSLALTILYPSVLQRPVHFANETDFSWHEPNCKICIFLQSNRIKTYNAFHFVTTQVAFQTQCHARFGEKSTSCAPLLIRAPTSAFFKSSCSTVLFFCNESVAKSFKNNKIFHFQSSNRLVTSHYDHMSAR